MVFISQHARTTRLLHFLSTLLAILCTHGRTTYLVGHAFQTHKGVWKHFENLPEGIKSAAIKATSKRESSTDIEYSRRKQYFIDNRISLEELLCQQKQYSCVREAHRFPFMKNKDRETEKTHHYTMADFIHDLETKRLKIVPCSGCYPDYQPNQQAHIGGCLGDFYVDIDV